MHYLDHACYSPPSPATKTAVQSAVCAYTSVTRFSATDLAMKWMDIREEARRAVAQLVAAPLENISLVESTTHGLGVVAGGLRLRSGENVVVGDCDFVGLPTVWRSQEASGVELRAVPSERGRVTVDAIRKAVDRRTRVIALSAVQEVSGQPVDLAAVATLAEDIGAFVVVDGIQEAGVLQRDPAQDGLAAYSAGGHKWLRAPYGLGFLWTSDILRDRLDPPFQGYFSLDAPPGGWPKHLNNPDACSLDLSVLKKTGQALELGGTPNWLGAVGLYTSLSGIGSQEPEVHALRLADNLREGLVALGVDVMTRPGTRSPIVTFTLGDYECHERFVWLARREGIQVSARAGAGIAGVRAGCHVDNSSEDIDALLGAVEHFIRL